MKLVLRIRERPDGTKVELDRPENIPGWGHESTLELDSSDAEVQAFLGAAFDDAITEALGKRLFDGLVKDNPGVHNGVVKLLVDGGSVVLDLAGNDVDSLPWECLCASANAGDPPRFISLDGWPVSRVVRDVARRGDDERFAVDISEGLRVFAVLGAQGWKATPEWRALRDTVLADGREATLHLLAADKEVLQEAAAHPAASAPAANGTPRLRVEEIKRGGGPALLEALAASRPHVLHVFCHGEATRSPYLIVSDVIDAELNAPGSIYIYPDDIIDAVARAKPAFDPLVAVLGCCRGARPGDTSRSMGRTLVQKRFHAAIGMSDIMDFGDLSTFSRAFYAGLLEALQKPEDVKTLSWPQLMLSPRQRLVPDPRPQHAPIDKRWVAPVLFERRDSLQAVGASGDLLVAIQVLEASLPALPPDKRAAAEATLATLRGQL